MLRYTYRGTEVPEGLPRIVSDDLFYEVQDMMNKKKKAPARAKAFEGYILSTKLFCGHCKAAMTGISGTGKTGAKYHYYQCVTNRRDKSCQKKMVRKDFIEDLVVTETRKLLTKENIDRIAKEVVRLCEQEKDTDNLKRLRKLLKENEQATENLFKALESGQIVDVIAERIAQKKQEHNELERLILEETSAHPLPTVNEVRFFLNQFRKGDVNDAKYRQALIDTFVNRIYLYDDKMTVLYNTQDSHSDVTIDDLSLSRVMLQRTVKIDIFGFGVKGSTAYKIEPSYWMPASCAGLIFSSGKSFRHHTLSLSIKYETTSTYCFKRDLRNMRFPAR